MTAAKLLQNTLSKLAKEPVEGFVCELLDESNLFKWRIYLEGPKDSPYEGGIFQLQMDFPDDYPMSPPTLKFTSAFWHPNVYEDGKVCISILHPPGEDPMSGELPQERWLPTQSVATIMLSVISMLNDPNISSPANVDASVEWRRDRTAYLKRCKELAVRSRNQAPPGLVIPHPDSDPVERQKAIAKMKEAENEDLELYSYGDDFEESDAEAEEDDGDLEDEDYNESDGDVEEDGEEEESSSLKRKAEDTDNDLKKKKKDPVPEVSNNSTSTVIQPTSTLTNSSNSTQPITSSQAAITVNSTQSSTSTTTSSGLVSEKGEDLKQDDVVERAPTVKHLRLESSVQEASSSSSTTPPTSTSTSFSASEPSSSSAVATSKTSKRKNKCDIM